MVQIALFQPEIPHNTGALIRLCACFDVTLNIIHPCGFLWSDKHLARSGLDYHELARVSHHTDWKSFQEAFYPDQVFLFSPRASKSYLKVSYKKDSVLLFGQESCGFPDEVEAFYKKHLYIPMKKDCRSLNLALSAAIGLSEAVRQLNVL